MGRFRFRLRAVETMPQVSCQVLQMLAAGKWTYLTVVSTRKNTPAGKKLFGFSPEPPRVYGASMLCSLKRIAFHAWPTRIIETIHHGCPITRSSPGERRNRTGDDVWIIDPSRRDKNYWRRLHVGGLDRLPVHGRASARGSSTIRGAAGAAAPGEGAARLEGRASCAWRNGTLKARAHRHGLPSSELGCINHYLHNVQGRARARACACGAPLSMTTSPRAASTASGRSTCAHRTSQPHTDRPRAEGLIGNCAATRASWSPATSQQAQPKVWELFTFAAPGRQTIALMSIQEFDIFNVRLRRQGARGFGGVPSFPPSPPRPQASPSRPAT